LISSKGLALLHSKLPGQQNLGAAEMFISGWDSSQVNSVAFSPSGHRVAAGGAGQVRIWDAATGKVIGSWWGGSTENFVKIGHSWLALLAAWLGGLLSKRLSGAARETISPVEGDRV
jgi:WD40 repeat protein